MKDHGNYDFDHRFFYGRTKKMYGYGEDSGNSGWAFERKQHTSAAMRRHYLKHCKSRKRQLLREELTKQLNED